MIKQQLSQKLLQKLSPQQIQLMKLLQVPTIALEQRIKEELEGNPALEEGNEIEQEYADEGDEYSDAYDEISESEKEFDFSDYVSDDDDVPSYKTYANNYSADDEDKSIPISGGASFHDILETQLGLRDLNDHEHEVALHLIGNIDESGYLRRDLSAIVDDLAFTQNIRTSEEELEDLLYIIQDFEPAGVGARDLQECLLIQLEKKGHYDEALANAREIIRDNFDAFTKKHYDKIVKRMDISEDELKDAIDEIIRLNPKPGNSMQQSSANLEHIVPDFLVFNTNDELEVQLNARNAPELKVSPKYNEMFKDYNRNKKGASKSQKDALLFVKQKLDSAKWFIDAIRQRQQTLLLTMNAIVEYQKDYFLTGDETKLRPMILKDIADMVGLDISTISRVANSKYVQTPFGTFLLKSFFSESLSTESGEEVSTREVKKILEDVVENEDKRKPLTDDKLAKLLKDKGYNIARRTVAKYREQLNIPVARLRKEI
ncbi:MAG: RNA polymerase sigma-54 factor [Crocinitomicaceae bacterium]|nr:RNA polymerase sigma-54 factor [Crocinitomicaceae bacterium]